MVVLSFSSHYLITYSLSNQTHAIVADPFHFFSICHIRVEDYMSQNLLGDLYSIKFDLHKCQSLFWLHISLAVIGTRKSIEIFAVIFALLFHRWVLRATMTVTAGGRIGQTKVKRYWPGKPPVWAVYADEDGDIRMFRAAALERDFPAQEHSDIVRKDDPRLRHLAENRTHNREEVRADHRRIGHAEIVSTIEEEAIRQEGLDADALEERRRSIKEKLCEREQEEAPLLPSEDGEEAEEEESEYETDSEEELTGIAMVKLVFVPRSERDTVAERARIEAEEWALEDLKKKKLEERKKETKQIVVEEIRKDEEIQKSLEQEANVADIDTDDGINEAEEYKAWKA